MLDFLSWLPCSNQSACHSEFIGKAFVDAGVRHVLCCEHEAKLLDEAAATFTQSFYSALCCGYTIKHAFDAAVAVVSVRHTKDESKTFMLLPENEDHNVPVFDAPVLEWEEGRIEQQSISSPVIFEGREIVMHDAISTILSRRRLVTLVGNPGIGRSSLALAIAGYIQERLRSISQIKSVFYVRRRDDVPKDFEGSLVQPLLEQLFSLGLAEERSDSTKSTLQMLCGALSKTKVLIVFDDLDGLEEEARRFFCSLYEKASGVQLLCVSQRPIHLISGAVIEKCIRIGPLDISSSATLFGKICPFADTRPKRDRLISGLLCRDSSVGGTETRKNHRCFPRRISDEDNRSSQIHIR